MKAKITKRYSITGGHFNVYADEKLIQCYTFRLNVPAADLWNEEKNYQQALELARKIESTVSFNDEEIPVYETIIPGIAHSTGEL
jgi:hypothetical protein